MIVVHFFYIYVLILRPYNEFRSCSLYKHHQWPKKEAYIICIGAAPFSSLIKHFSHKGFSSLSLSLSLCLSLSPSLSLYLSFFLSRSSVCLSFSSLFYVFYFPYLPLSPHFPLPSLCPSPSLPLSLSLSLSLSSLFPVSEVWPATWSTFPAYVDGRIPENTVFDWALYCCSHILFWSCGILYTLLFDTRLL